MRLHDLVDPGLLAQDPVRAVRDAALLVARAGVQVAVETRDEVVALAWAGERVAEERAAMVGRAVKRPALAFLPFDGGTALGDEILTAALEKAACR